MFLTYNYAPMTVNPKKKSMSAFEILLISFAVAAGVATLCSLLDASKNDKTSLALAVGLIATSAGNYAATQVGKDHYERQACKMEIFDIGYKMIPQFDIPWYMHEAYTCLWLPILFTLPDPLKFEITQAVSTRFIALLALRAITTVTTILPKQEPCNSTFTWKTLVTGMCYDKVFSGHTALAVLVSLAFVSSGVWPAWVGWLYTSGMAALLLVTRGHYTVDIVLGAAFGYLSWNCNVLGNKSIKA
jgi:hypothetical protein